MQSVISVLESLESDGSRLAKEAILLKEKDNELLRQVFAAAGDPYIDYGVRKFKIPQASNVGLEDDGVVAVFALVLLPRLASRELSGNAAKNAVEEAFSGMTALQQKWCQRLLLKNLRCGVSEKTVNKLWPGLISRFDVMLACKVDVDDKNTPTGVKYPIRVEPKLDGLRLVAIKKQGVVSLYTRNGNPVDTLPSIKGAIETLQDDDIVLDGEALCADWNMSNSIMMSTKRAKDDSEMVFNVFDVVPLGEWLTKEATMPLTQRLEMLSRITEGLDNGVPIKRVTGITATNVDEVMMYYSECLASGYEGVMLKDMDARYVFERSDNVKKFKPVQTFEGVVIGWYEGIVGRKREGMFAGFNVLFPNGIVTRVGNGFSDVLKKEINDLGPDTFNGRVVEVEGQPDAVTQSGFSKDGKVRFPVFIRFRDSNDVDPAVLEAYRARPGGA